MICWESPGDEAVLTQHFQCKLAKDYIMVVADLGQSWGFSALQTPRALAGIGVSYRAHRLAWGSRPLLALGLAAGSVSDL